MSSSVAASALRREKDIALERIYVECVSIHHDSVWKRVDMFSQKLVQNSHAYTMPSNSGAKCGANGLGDGSEKTLKYAAKTPQSNKDIVTAMANTQLNDVELQTVEANRRAMQLQFTEILSQISANCLPLPSQFKAFAISGHWVKSEDKAEIQGETHTTVLSAEPCDVFSWTSEQAAEAGISPWRTEFQARCRMFKKHFDEECSKIDTMALSHELAQQQCQGEQTVFAIIPCAARIQAHASQGIVSRCTATLSDVLQPFNFCPVATGTEFDSDSFQRHLRKTENAAMKTGSGLRITGLAKWL